MVKTDVNTNGNHITISAEGAFGFNMVSEFRNSYVEYKEYDFTVDFRKVDYIDSAGLGMLLNMQNYLEKKDLEIRITNPLPQVKKILMISRFDKKFIID